MIAFQHQGVTAAQAMRQMRRCLSGVGEHAQLEAVIPDDVLNRLAGIVRYGIGCQLKMANAQPLAIPAKMNRNVIAVLAHCLIGSVGQPDWKPMAASKL